MNILLFEELSREHIKASFLNMHLKLGCQYHANVEMSVFDINTK